MSLVNIINIQIHNNPSLFTSPISFTITFECLKDIPGELDWKLIYVGSSNDESYDQELEAFSMGPLSYGVMQFDLEAEAPDHKKIPQGELLGVTALILTASYNSQEFFRIGYYVYNNYNDPELLENPPEKVRLEAVHRNILADKPRITRFDMKWEDSASEENFIEKLREGESSNNFDQAINAHMLAPQGTSKDGQNNDKQSDVMNTLFNEKYGENSNNPFFENSNGVRSNTIGSYPSLFMDNAGTSA